MAAPRRLDSLPPGAADYPAPGGFRDEAMSGPGQPRAGYEPVLAALGRHDLETLAERVRVSVEAIGAIFGPGRPFPVDPVPRLLEAAEWEWIESGCEQRARALNSFIADLYGERRIFAAGLVPDSLIETSAGFEPRMMGLIDPSFPAATVAGLDLVRGAGGGLAVLEDNLRMPSGAVYAAAAREAVLPALGADAEPVAIIGFADRLGEAIRAAAPDGRGDPSAALLSDGPGGGAWFEHSRLAGEIGIPLVELSDIETAAGRAYARIEGRRRPLDVIYRRIDGDRLTGAAGEETPIGQALLPTLHAGTLRCINAFGTAVADDKLAHAYVEEMIRFYLAEQPIIPSVKTIDMSDPSQRERALARQDSLVIKPRVEFGGSGVVILSRAGAAERRSALDLLEKHPERFVAQEMVAISTHPTVCGGRLRPRHVDLRPFVVSGPGGPWAMPGGLTRFARVAGEMVVNSSRGGGGKDTWVMPGAVSGAAP